MTLQEKECPCNRGEQSEEKTMPRVLTRNNINKTHVSDCLS